jgi:serine/threonine protein kinase
MAAPWNLLQMIDTSALICQHLRLSPRPTGRQGAFQVASLAARALFPRRCSLSDVKKLGKFEIICKIGQGAMGVVYKARDPFLNRTVALKTLNPGLFEDSVLLKRFYSEARSAGCLRHPNIVTIYELGYEGDMPFIAMQFLNGESLDKVIDRLPNLPLSQKVGFIVYTCRALDYAHKQNPPVIHRDIKPGNVMVGPDGSVMVVDFGIARLGETSITQSSGLLIGTLGYMSPQLFHGGTADARSDIWATGVMFYELLAYRRPFRGENAAALMSNVVLEEPRPISEAAPGTPEDIERILGRMLAKSAEERYQSMDEVLMDLEPVWKRLLQADISILLENTERLLNEGDLLAAKSEIVQILNWDSTNPQAKRVSDLINTELRKQKLYPQVKVHVENAQKLLSEGHPEEARSEAQLALRLDSSYQPAVEIVRQAQALLERSREIRHALRVSKELMAEGALTEAETQLGKALALDPSNEVARDHLKHLRDERERRELRRQRDTLLQRARTLWTNLQYEDCISLLLSLDKQFPDDLEILKFLDAAREDQAEQQRQAFLVDIRNLLSTEQFETALKSLDTFLAKFPSDATANSLRSHALHGRDLQQREQRVNDGKAQLQALMSQEKYEETVVRGKELQREFPWDSELSDLLALARAKRSEIEQRLRLEQFARQIQQMMKGGHFEDAIETSESALSEFPDNAEILSLAEHARNEQAEKGKQDLIKRRVREVERMLKHHQLTDAVDLARQTVSTLGPDSRLVAVLHQVEKELEFREQRKQRQAETIQTVRTLLNDGRLTDAALLLKDAIESRLFAPDDAQIRAFFEEIGARRRPPATPDVPSEPSAPTAASGLTLVLPITDPAKDYVFLGGTAQPDAPANAEQSAALGEVSSLGAIGKPVQSSRAPLVESQSVAPGFVPSSPEIIAEGSGKESLDLKAIERHLAFSLGPIARFMVQKAAAKAKNQDELFGQLASMLSSQQDRQAFLAKKKEFLRIPPPEIERAKGAAGGGEKQADMTVPRIVKLNPADLHKAAELLAHYLGPVSRILTERAARHTDTLSGLYMILADHLTDNSERARFLREAGFPES